MDVQGVGCISSSNKGGTMEGGKFKFSLPSVSIFFFGGILLFLKNKTHTTEWTQHWPFRAADVFYGFMNTEKSLNGRNIFLIRLHPAPRLAFHLCPFWRIYSQSLNVSPVFFHIIIYSFMCSCVRISSSEFGRVGLARSSSSPSADHDIVHVLAAKGIFA